MAQHGKFYWNELMTDDVDKAVAFYRATLGWAFREMPADAAHKYQVAFVGEEPVAGIMDMTDIMPANVPPHWFSYINVDDLHNRLKMLEENGGQIVRPPFEVPGVGVIAIVRDATGAGMGWMMAEEM